MNYLALASLIALVLAPEVSLAKAKHKKEKTRSTASMVNDDTVTYNAGTNSIFIESEPTGDGAAYEIFNGLIAKGYKEKTKDSKELNESTTTIEGKNISCMQVTGLHGGYKAAACTIKIQ